MNKVTYEIDIAQEFKDVKSALTGLQSEISQWKNSIDNQLTKLNTNMERVLNTIAEHEVRLTNLEQKQLKSDTKYDTIAELIKLGIWVAKWAFGAGIIYATAHYSDIIAAIQTIAPAAS